MKIGILTFHDAHNYGAALQAFALQEYIKSKGHEVFFLDYHLNYVNKYYRWFNLSKIIRKNVLAGLKEFVRLPLRRKRYKMFNLFIEKNFHLLQVEKTGLDKKLDLLIVGSDQLWNYVLTGGFNNLYWGNIPGYTKPMITYAISMEVQPADDIIKDKIKKCIKNFDGISVRENTLRKTLQPLTNKEIRLCLDPTMLVSIDIWNKVVSSPIIKDPYVLLYQVRSSKTAEIIASKIADMYKCKVVKLYASADEESDTVCFGAGPSEFLNLIKYAKHVVSVSFHGTIFPLVFHVPITPILLGDGKDDRVLSILNRLDLEHLAMSDASSLQLPSIDWIEIDSKIQEIRKDSENYLNEYV